tara:strand:+ start:403 stop:513 length:111 start_codon:yes stop_codon:yes gene_type:complete
MKHLKAFENGNNEDHLDDNIMLEESMSHDNNQGEFP